jgi:hypothetical protein
MFEVFLFIFKIVLQNSRRFIIVLQWEKLRIVNLNSGIILRRFIDLLLEITMTCPWAIHKLTGINHI